MKTDKNIILFGAGEIGRQALAYYGHARVLCFVDNDERKAGTYIDETPIISFSQLKEWYKSQPIILSMDVGNSLVVSAQLEEAGIHNFKLFLDAAQLEEPVMIPTVQNAEALQTAWEGKRVLMIAYQFPPLSGSGVFRSIKFAKYLPEFHWQPTVISTDRPRLGWNYSDEELLREIPSNVSVIRIPDRVGTLRGSLSGSLEDKLLSFLGNILRHSERAHNIFSSFLQTKEGRAKLMTFPCGALAWVYDVVTYIENNLDIHQFQSVYTTSAPYSAHLAGLYLKKTYGIPWIADYRDPWTASQFKEFDYKKPEDQLFFDLEDILLHAANRSIAVGEHDMQDYIERFHIPSSNLATITNGYDEEDFSALGELRERPDKFTIYYNGILHTTPAIHVFSACLKAVQELIEKGNLDVNQVRLHMVGDTQAASKTLENRLLNSILVHSGYLSHEQALQASQNANLLLLPIGDSPLEKFIYSGKIFDYLRSGVPILAIAPEDSVVDQVLRETRHGQTFRSTQTAEIQAFIMQEYHRWQSGEKREALHSPLIHKYERKLLTKQLASILDQVSQ